ncbi:MAG TPA: cell division protein ZapB [Sumerlaeia bacterium]|nr:cell division protein ZapB [Sumerlaeia bacterium]
MLDEKLQQLETRVSDLLEDLRRLREENAALQEEIGPLRKKAEEYEALSQENARLHERVSQFEAEIAASAAKESEVRERLRSIIEKIDALEQTSGGE